MTGLVTTKNRTEPATPNPGETVRWIDDVTKTLKSKDDTGAVTDYAGGGNGFDKWVAGTTYAVDDEVWYDVDDKIYVCITANSDATFTPAKWKVLAKYDADEIASPTIGTPTYTTIQDNINIFHGSGVGKWNTPHIANDGDGTITVNSGIGFIKAVDSETTTLYTFDWASEAGANVALVDNSINYLYVEYNTGSPQVVATTTKRTDYSTNIFLGNVYREGTALHITAESQYHIGDHAGRMIRRMQDLSPFAHKSGAAISETGTRNIAVSAGAFWQGLIEYTTDAFNSSGADNFSYFYRNGVGGWTEVTAQTQVDNLQYDDGTGTLATLGNSKYGVHWIFMGVDGDIYLVYGQGSYTLLDAESAQVPASLPPHFEDHGRIIGRIIIAKSASTFTDITSAFATAFEGAAPSDHADLTGLQGGAADEYYHLTAAEYTALGAAGDVSGPATSTDNAIARYDSTTGKLLQDSGAQVDDSGHIRLPDGTSAACAIGFIGKANSGIYRSGNQLYLVANGVPVLDLAASRTSLFAAIRGATSDETAPTYSFNSMSNGGFYKDATVGDLRMAVSGIVAQMWKSTEVEMNLPLKLKGYTTAGLPSAASFEGCKVYNTDTNETLESDGTSWLASGGGKRGITSDRPAVSDLGSNNVQYFIDEASNTLNFLLKYADGTAKRGIVPLVSAAAWADATYYQLDGVDERFETPSDVTATKLGVSGAGAYSIVMTLNLDMSRTKTATLFSFFAGTADGKFEANWINSVFRFQVGTNYTSVSPTRSLKNYHLAFVFDGSQGTDITRAKIYVDGALPTVTASGTIPTTITTEIATEILGIASRTGSPANFFDEKVKEVSMYNKALSSTEVSNLYNSGSFSDPLAVSGCVASWWFGDNSDDTELIVIDNASNNNLTPINIEAADII